MPIATLLDTPNDLAGTLQRLAIALALGFLVGLERGWRQRDGEPGSRAAGLRTFALSGLYGGLCGLAGLTISPWVLAAGFLAFAGGFTLFELRRGEELQDFSATAVVAGLTTAFLGILAFYVPSAVVAAATVAMIALLAFRDALHTFLSRLTWPEVRSAVVLLAMTFVITPVLPDSPIDPFGALNPRSLWWMTVLLGGASFLGYIALRALPAATGLTVSAIAGAIVSSTAVTLDLARRVGKDEAPVRPALDAAFAAACISLTRVGLVTSVAAPKVIAYVWPGLAGAFVVFAAGFLLLRRRQAGEPPAAPPNLGSPLDLSEVAKFALLLAGLTVISKLAARIFGPQAILIFAPMAGFADVDAAVLAVTQQRDLVPTLAATAILMAIAANMVLRVIVATTAGKRAFGLPYIGASILALASGAAAAWAGWMWS